MDKKERFIKKLESLGYQCEDEHGVVMIPLNHEDYYNKKSHRGIHLAARETGYDCSYGIRLIQEGEKQNNE